MTAPASAMDKVRWVANLHTLFPEVPLLQRPAAAAAARLTEVEYWWPFDGQPRPTAAEVNALVEAVESARVRLTAMNLYAGNMAAGDRGVVSHPDKVDDFRASVEVAMHIGQRLGTRLFNVPYGRRLPGVPEDVQDSTAVDMLTYAAQAAQAIGASVLVEPLSGFPDYPVRTSRAAVDVIERVRSGSHLDSIGLLMDQYHLATNGEDVLADLEFVMPYLRHVQVADVPGRGAPGSADGDIRGYIEALLERGYDGAIALEYVPQGDTVESLVVWRRTFGLS